MKLKKSFTGFIKKKKKLYRQSFRATEWNYERQWAKTLKRLIKRFFGV